MFKKILLAVMASTLLLSGITAAPANAVTIKVVSAPTITKYAKVGSKLTAVGAKFNVKTTKVSWQWYYAGKAIPKATANTYVVKSTQKTGTQGRSNRIHRFGQKGSHVERGEHRKTLDLGQGHPSIHRR